ncbi:MAG: acetyl-CoA carboxylase, carboxyltransferase subunit beta [Sphaerochaetaceae bacterium]
MNASEKCPVCQMETSCDQLKTHHMVCPGCAYHYPLDPAQRIASLVDGDSFTPFPGEFAATNPIELQGYAEKVLQNQAQTSLREAVVTGTCRIEGQAIVLGVMSFQFMGGSMGSVVGEKITQAMYHAVLHRLPVVLFTASGGARMQEGIFSLMQMAKTASAVALMGKTRTPLFIVLTHPTTGGVTASFAMLGDVIIAEPGALIGFAGPRVIEGTLHQQLPPGFQRSEFQMEKGFLDAIIHRDDLRSTLAFLIKTHPVPSSRTTGRTTGHATGHTDSRAATPQPGGPHAR